ncbi:hypothetical protein D3C73_909440 [compost metagenome]
MADVPVLTSFSRGLSVLLLAERLELYCCTLRFPLPPLDVLITETARVALAPALKVKVSVVVPTGWAPRYDLRMVTVVPETE